MKITQKIIDLAKRNGVAEDIYGDLVSQKIRSRYSVDSELAILRQRDEKPDEFAEYNAYAERCKIEAKAELGIE